MSKRIVLTVCLAAFTVIAPAQLSAGGVGGGTTQNKPVGGFKNQRFTPVVFRAGDEAVVTVSGDGDTDLDLYVYDDNGNLVAKDDDSTDQCLASWTPKWTGRFFIVVKNRGSIYNQYRLRTN